MDAPTLQACTGCSAPNAALWLTPVTRAMAQYQIDTPARQAAFLAQVSEESEHFIYTTELWGPTAQQLTYEGRTDLGNTQPGDGYRFRGRGLIDITGRVNYTAVAEALCIDCIANPAMVAEPAWAALSAAWWWAQHGLNPLADAGNFRRITTIINGGQNGYADRCTLWAAAKQALGVAS